MSPSHHRAHSSLGYVLRKVGQYDDSIDAYDRALQIEPGFPEALEYRGEAYLALGRLKDASRSYMQLVEVDLEKAELLMTAMKDWLDAPETTAINGTKINAATIDWFRGWMTRRTPRDGETPAVSSAGPNW